MTKFVIYSFLYVKENCNIPFCDFWGFNGFNLSLSSLTVVYVFSSKFHHKFRSYPKSRKEQAFG